jgi:hypothetical protein
VTVPAGTRLTYTCTHPEKQGIGNGALRRLTRTQLANTLRDLLGADVLADSEIQTSLNRLGADAVTGDIAQFSLTPSAEQPGAMIAIAARVADLAEAPKKAGDLFGACAQQTPVTDACATTFVTSFGQRAFRRPLAPTEVTSFVATFRANGGGIGGLQAALMRFVQAPAMVFQVELGKPPSAGRVQLTDYEVATRVSYLVANTMPDQALFAAAAAGELQDVGKVRAQVERLLGSSPSAQDKLKEFLGYYMELGDTEAPFAGAAMAKNIDTKGLEAEMVKEALEFGAYQALKKPNSTFRDLLSGTDVFPRSARMAMILEAGVATGDQPSQTNARHAGLLLRPALLASGQPRTPAMHRGKVVRQQFLCGELPPPPAEAIVAISMAPDKAKFSNRAWHEMVTAPPNCSGCHALVNPLGFALENYDQLGMIRTSDVAFDAAGKAGPSYPVDTAVKGLALEAGAAVSTAAYATELVTAVANTAAARACVAKTAFEYFRLREILPEADGCALRALESAATDAGSLRTFFVTNIANDDIFWRKAN